MEGIHNPRKSAVFYCRIICPIAIPCHSIWIPPIPPIPPPLPPIPPTSRLHLARATAAAPLAVARCSRTLLKHFARAVLTTAYPTFDLFRGTDKIHFYLLVFPRVTDLDKTRIPSRRPEIPSTLLELESVFITREQGWGSTSSFRCIKFRCEPWRNSGFQARLLS